MSPELTPEEYEKLTPREKRIYERFCEYAGPFELADKGEKEKK